MPSAILHIGTEKTGTTTLQAFLKQNRAVLDQHGFHHPVFAGRINHTGLAAYASDDAVRDDLRIDLGIHDAEGLKRFRHQFEVDAAAEVDRNRERIFVFSNEHCSSRLTTPQQIARLRDFLARFFDRVTVTVYLRRQDQVAVSLYSTLLKFGGDRWEILPDPRLRSTYWDYDRLLALWADAFGAENVVPRIFDRAELFGGSVVSDFVRQWGLGQGFGDVRDTNESLQPHAGEFLRRLNTAFPGYVNGEFNRMRGELGARIGTLFPGRGPKPSRAEAMAFYQGFAAPNEAVRARWFPARATLFPEDFSSYPETAENREFSFDEAIEVATALWRETQAKEIELRYGLAVRDGQIAELQGDSEGAMQAYQRAVRIDPNRPLAEWRLEGLRKQIAEQTTARWALEDARLVQRLRLRKRVSLNGIRRLLGVAPR